MRDPFKRATESILNRLGQDALLRGAPAGRVNIEHGVEVYGDPVGSNTIYSENASTVFPASVATIQKQFAPRRGDALALFEDDGTPILPTYTVGKLVQDNGHTVRYVVLPVDDG